MVLLIGNFLPDQQHSMQRFSEMMLRELRAINVPARLIQPQPRLANSVHDAAAKKWAAYFDKLILFPPRFSRRWLAGVQLVHICDHSNAVYARFFSNVPVVVTCHDLLAVRGALGEQTDCPASVTGKLLQRWILSGLRRAAAVVCVSRATAADANRLLAIKQDRPRISVIENGLNYEYQPLPETEIIARLAPLQQLQLDRPFVLHVGSGLRRKNRAGVLRMFALTKEKWNAQLIFAGDPMDAELSAMARELGISQRIIEIASPPSALLEALYNRAHALLFPSRFEGFGWPIAEAQACGCPVLTTNAAPMSEVAGDAALLHEVTDETVFAQDLLRLRDPALRAKYRDLGLKNAARFDPRKMAQRYVEIYRQLGAAA